MVEIKKRKGKKPLELAGQRFGQLTVIERYGYQGKRITWRCICDCGREKITLVEYLRSGHVRSCGCLSDDPETLKRKNGWQSTRESCAWILYKGYRHNAELRNKTFDLSFDEFKKLTSQNCHYCGCSPDTKTKSTKAGECYIYNGIDRKDNSIGYELNNCIPCCTFCNKAKHTNSYQDFQSWLYRVAEHKELTKKQTEFKLQQAIFAAECEARQLYGI